MTRALRPTPTYYAIRRWQAGYKRVRRVIKVPCPDCYGTGRMNNQYTCGNCDGSGEVEKWVNEIVHEDE